ncbi:hypothetical protein WG922_07665 [Ramlibacter sp. AN1015]|uniref:hypothetical protein n=1 Tax=Ramlibacter sp. AN1015 TaxID=3133428 RepID=UPI0030BCADF6
MELANLLPKAQPLEVIMPDGSPSGIVLQVVGHDSAQFTATAKKWANVMLEKEDGAKTNIDELEKQNADLVASFIVGWTGLEENGAPLPYSHEKAVQLMSMPELKFVRERVEAFASKRTNFFRPRTQAVGVGSTSGDQA